MSSSFDVTFHMNDPVTFTSDLNVPEELQGQTFTVTKIKTLILNDFYFNQAVFPTYELTHDTMGSLWITPFHFEDDHEGKWRVIKVLSPNDIKQLFRDRDLKEVFRKTTNPEEAQTIYFEENVPSALRPWLGRSYYIDLKENAIATATYVDYDLGNKKNVNPTLLLGKHTSQQYTLFQGDYALYFLEANFDAPDPLLATFFLDQSAIAPA